PYRVVVSNAFGVATSATATLSVLVTPSLPPLLGSTNVPLGSNVTFCVTATGDEPLSYQWRKNGANLLGATNRCFTITNVQIADGGSYAVVVANAAGAVLSTPTLLVIDVPQLQPGDNFVDAVTITGNGGIIGGTNSSATIEAG